jgi:adenylosuccinate lyase
VSITEEQIKELEEHIMDIDFDKAEKKETETRHDVMAHVYTYGEVCPKVRGSRLPTPAPPPLGLTEPPPPCNMPCTLQAKGIIHLGATSCFVGDNTDVVQLKESLVLLRRKLVKLLAQMKTFARAWPDLV